VLIIPAVDIKDGRCVRLLRGDMSRETVYAEDPVEMALKWAEQGARYLHVVDLDGAVQGHPVNAEAVKRIVSSISIPAEVGGGVRSASDVDDYLDAGLDRVVMSSRALADPHGFARLVEARPGRIALGLDARGGRVTTDGWLQQSKTTIQELVHQVESLALAAVIYTNVMRDGTLEGPDVEGVDTLTRVTGLPVIASGGVASLEDVRALSRVPLEGIIVGKALYVGAVDLRQAIDIVSSEQASS